MASFSVEEFVGNGALKDIVEYLLSEGWDDVPTLKMMNAQDMEAHNLTQQQQDALEIRSYLHDRSLMEYAERLEASGKSLPELLSTDPRVLCSQYSMKRGHVARFVDRSVACGIPLPPSAVLPARKRLNSNTSELSEYSISSTAPPNRQPTMITSPLRNPTPMKIPTRTVSSVAASAEYSVAQGAEQRVGGGGGVMKGIVAAVPPEPRFCGLISPQQVADDVAPYSVMEGISVQKLTPEYKIGMEAYAAGELRAPPPLKASELWATKPAVVLCIRRPGCVMCRAEAHQIYARKPIFDSMGFQLIAVVHEFIPAEIKEFWPRYWGGIVTVDAKRDFFRALGGGRLLKEAFITGFIFNPRAIANYKRARATGIQMNYTGEGSIKGGLFVIGSGKSGVAYQFAERNFGDWAPLAEVIEVCSKLQKDKLLKENGGSSL